MNLSQAANAAKILFEWLGGPPDPRAQDRADVCTGRLNGFRCPHNYQGAWLAPAAVAKTVKALFEAKNQIALEVKGEERLGHCEICSCVLALKVHVPAAIILKHTNPEELHRFPPYCWLLTETQQPQNEHTDSTPSGNSVLPEKPPADAEAS